MHMVPKISKIKMLSNNKMQFGNKTTDIQQFGKKNSNKATFGNKSKDIIRKLGNIFQYIAPALHAASYIAPLLV